MSLIEPSDITAEKSLWTIWTMARRIRRKRFNRGCMILVVCALALYLSVSKQTPHEIAEMVRSWANVGLGFAATILGFLVAGFTIFATLSKPSLLAAMAQHTEDQSGLSYLKYNFFIFFETFGWYVGFAAVCILVLVFGSVGGATTQLSSALPGSWRRVSEWMLPRGSALVVGAWFMLLCLELKSFIFNIYHVVMTSIRWTVEYPEDASCRYLPAEPGHQTSSVAKPPSVVVTESEAK